MIRVTGGTHSLSNFCSDEYRYIIMLHCQMTLVTAANILACNDDQMSTYELQ